MLAWITRLLICVLKLVEYIFPIRRLHSIYEQQGHALNIERNETHTLAHLVQVVSDPEIASSIESCDHVS